MQKKIGYILGVLFILFSIVNFINNPELCRINVMGMLLIGVCYLESSYFGIYGRITQIATTIGFSALAVYTNEPNSLVPVVALMFGVLLSTQYFPNKKHLIKYYALAPLMTSLITMWNLASIINNILLYIGLTAILYIIYNE